MLIIYIFTFVIDMTAFLSDDRNVANIKTYKIYYTSIKRVPLPNTPQSKCFTEISMDLIKSLGLDRSFNFL